MDNEAPPKPVQIEVVFDNVRDGLRISRRARAAAVDAIVHGVQLVGNAVGNVRTCARARYNNRWWELRWTRPEFEMTGTMRRTVAVIEPLRER
jgi:uncharacterized protein with HEPN domain